MMYCEADSKLLFPTVRGGNYLRIDSSLSALIEPICKSAEMVLRVKISIDVTVCFLIYVKNNLSSKRSRLTACASESVMSNQTNDQCHVNNISPYLTADMNDLCKFRTVH